MNKKGKLWTALLALALAFAVLAPSAAALDGSAPVYNPFWREYTGDAFLPLTETVIERWGETTVYRFEYELLRDGEGRVTEILGRKYDEEGALVELRSYDGRGKPTRITAYREGRAVEMTELSYRFDGNMYKALSEERVTDLLTGEVRRTAYYQSGKGAAIPVHDGETPGFSYDPETWRIEGASWWEDPTGRAEVLGADGVGGRIWEGMELGVSRPFDGAVCVGSWYERLPSGERGALLSAHYEVLNWFDGPCYVLDWYACEEGHETSEDWYYYNTAVNCVLVWVHRDSEGETAHRYTVCYYNGIDGLKDFGGSDDIDWMEGSDWKSELSGPAEEAE